MLMKPIESAKVALQTQAWAGPGEITTENVKCWTDVWPLSTASCCLRRALSHLPWP
jgi:hypothetical protein